MKFVYFVVSAIGVLVGACSCGSPSAMNPAITLEIVNESSDDIRNAEVRFSESSCKWGTVVRNTSASYISYPHSISSDAEMHWDSGGVHHNEKIDIRHIYRFGDSGDLTFTVYDSHVSAEFRQKS